MKKMIIATTCIATLLCSTSILASSVTKMIEVSNAPNTIYVDGSKIETESFLYNGTTYVPLRTVSEALGAGVGFDANNKKINISSDGTVVNGVAVNEVTPKEEVVVAIKNMMNLNSYSYSHPDFNKAVIYDRTNNRTVYSENAYEPSEFYETVYYNDAGSLWKFNYQRFLDNGNSMEPNIAENDKWNYILSDLDYNSTTVTKVGDKYVATCPNSDIEYNFTINNGYIVNCGDMPIVGQRGGGYVEYSHFNQSSVSQDMEKALEQLSVFYDELGFFENSY